MVTMSIPMEHRTILTLILMTMDYLIKMKGEEIMTEMESLITSTLMTERLLQKSRISQR